MSEHNLDLKSFVSFEHSVAGHEGMLCDASQELVIKPCIQAEIDFYQYTSHAYPDFYAMMPNFLGTLELSTPEQVQALQNQDPSSLTAALNTQCVPTGPSVLAAQDGKTLYGRKLDTDKAIVLENLAAGYVKPNVLDVKLGSRLWADSALPAKRARMDQVSSQTTSGSLGFRIAGMRVWDSESSDPKAGHSGQYKIYDKLYGRAFTSENVRKGFETFFFGESQVSEQQRLARKLILDRCTRLVTEMQEILSSLEIRMFSSSVLIVFEGDHEALERALEEEEARLRIEVERTKDLNQREEVVQDGKSDTSSESEEHGPRVCDVRLIDFAHAVWAPGEGPDENSLQGVKSVRAILESMLEPE